MLHTEQSIGEKPFFSIVTAYLSLNHSQKDSLKCAAILTNKYVIMLGIHC